MKSRDGILEQPGRMAVQVKLACADCIYLANLAVAAVQNGYITREVGAVLKKIRMAAKSSIRNPDSEALYCTLGDAVDILRRMGGIARKRKNGLLKSLLQENSPALNAAGAGACF